MLGRFAFGLPRLRREDIPDGKLADVRFGGRFNFGSTGIRWFPTRSVFVIVISTTFVVIMALNRESVLQDVPAGADAGAAHAAAGVRSAG